MYGLSPQARDPRGEFFRNALGMRKRFSEVRHSNKSISRQGIFQFFQGLPFAASVTAEEGDLLPLNFCPFKKAPHGRGKGPCPHRRPYDDDVVGIYVHTVGREGRLFPGKYLFPSPEVLREKAPRFILDCG